MSEVLQHDEEENANLVEKTDQGEQQQSVNKSETKAPNQETITENLQDLQQEQDNEDNLNDYSCIQPEDGKASVFQAQVNLFKGLVGLGILALPIGFSQAGWLIGLITIPIVGYVMYYCACLMLDLADSHAINPANISEFCYFMFKQPGVKGSGKTARAYVILFLFFLQFGVCIGYTIFFMNYFQASFCHFGWQDGCDNRMYAVFTALAIVLPLGLIRNINKLKTPSNIANIILLFSLFVMLYDSYSEILVNGSKLEKVADFWGFSGYIGIVVFTLEGVGLFFDIRHSMREPKDFKPALLNVVHVAVILYATIGFVGYMAFGNKVQDLLLFNLPMDNDFYFSIQIAYSLVLCLSFPLQLFPCANYLELEIKKSLFPKSGIKKQLQQGQESNEQDPQQQQQASEQNQNNNQNQQEEQQQQEVINPDDQLRPSRGSNVSVDPHKLELTKEEESTLTLYSYGMRVILTLGIFCIAMTLTKVSVFLNLAGSIGGISLLYIIPVLTYNMNAKDVSQKTLILNWIISGLGLFAGLCGIYTSMVDIYADMENGFDLFFF